jgi:integrase
MAGRQAKTIAPLQFRALLRTLHRYSNPVRSRAIVLLSVKAGLRASEIAKLEWPMILDAAGNVSECIEINDRIAKKGSGRRIPMNAELRSALVTLLKQSDGVGPVISDSRAVRHIRDVGLSSHKPPSSLIAQAVRFAMSNCSPVIAR